MQTTRFRQVVDWSAAVWAGLASGLGHLLVTMLLSLVITGSATLYLRVIASLLLGGDVLPPPATITLPIALVGFFTHMVISMLFALLVAVVVHRWGMIVGIVGGGLLGVAIYIINYFAIAVIFPWMHDYRGVTILVAHIVFGMVAGGVYEALEVEEYVAVEAERI